MSRSHFPYSGGLPAEDAQRLIKPGTGRAYNADMPLKLSEQFPLIIQTRNRRSHCPRLHIIGGKRRSFGTRAGFTATRAMRNELQLARAETSSRLPSRTDLCFGW